MTRIRTSLGRHVSCFVVTASLFACGASERKAAEAPKATATPPPMQPGAYPAQAPPAEASAESAKAPGVSAGAAPYVDRSMAMSQATGEVVAAERQLELSGGDCQNACRALGSMDRATGRLCVLAQSNEETRRCGDARNRLYSARDRVRSSCGTCPDVSVDRNAPIPSR